MKRVLIGLVGIAAVALWAGVVQAGEYHSGADLVCYDCHTIHYSMQHGWDSSSPPANAPTIVNGTFVSGNWLGSTGPNEFLLKMPVNQLCITCHDGKTFAPDVVGINNNASPANGRSAGALNNGSGSPYEDWKGHTLGSTVTPPGYNPDRIGAPATWYTDASSGTGLTCVNCHAQHGPATAYRNLGPYALGGAASNARPTYVISTTNNTTQDVWINVASHTPATGDASIFNPYYATANISFNRTDSTTGAGAIKTSNRMDTFCAACHGNFHGGPNDAEIGGVVVNGAYEGYLRHPTSQVLIGAATAAGLGGHSNLPRFVANTTKVRVYADDRAAYGDATPGCPTCHKAHGNQNPFSLIFLNRNATAVDEQGGFGAGQPGADPPLVVGLRNLCGQCHGQGN